MYPDGGSSVHRLLSAVPEPESTKSLRLLKNTPLHKTHIPTLNPLFLSLGSRAPLPLWRPPQASYSECFTKLRKEVDLTAAVSIANPQTQEFQVPPHGRSQWVFQWTLTKTGDILSTEKLNCKCKVQVVQGAWR